MDETVQKGRQVAIRRTARERELVNALNARDNALADLIAAQTRIHAAESDCSPEERQRVYLSIANRIA